MNKIEIIQRLLDERHITAKEALVLMEKEREYVYYPQPYTWPNWPITTVYTTTNGDTTTEMTVNSN